MEHVQDALTQGSIIMNPAAKDGFSAKFIFKVIRKRAPMFALVFALLFSIIAVAQYLFVRHGVYKSAELQMQQWADEVAAEIDYKDKWDLKAYRQSEELAAPHIFTFTSDGTVVDTVGFIPGMVGRVKLLDDSIFAEPKTITVAETGETWREFAIRVKGGIVAFGILNPQEVAKPDDFLKSAADQFGPTVEDAVKVRLRQLPSQVDYAVIDDSGNLLAAADSFPLQAEPSAISELAQSRALIQEGDKSYLIVSKAIMGSRGDNVGTIIIPKEFTGEERVIRQHIAFNAIATMVSWLTALAVVIGFLAVEDWRHRPQAVLLEDALRNGESQSVEFKEGHADVPLQRAIAAFANTNSGTVFLGVNNRAEVVGIDCNTAQKKDEELLRIRNITTQAIKPAISVHVDFIVYQGKTVARIFIPRGEQPLYFLNHEIYVREQTTSMKATPEQVERIVAQFYG
jgi:acid stress-induced BolA-like protein IbaG/YrbA